MATRFKTWNVDLMEVMLGLDDECNQVISALKQSEPSFVLQDDSGLTGKMR